jgi:hypothetical protein
VFGALGWTGFGNWDVGIVGWDGKEGVVVSWFEDGS